MEDLVASTDARRAEHIVDARRVGFMAAPDDWCVHVFDRPKFRSPVILPWIAKHTKGRFYLSGNSVGFENETDMLMFKLGYNDSD